MPIDASEQIDKLQEFLDSSYKKELHQTIREDKKAIVINFSDISKFDPDLAEQFLNEPEETLKAAELSLEHFDLPEDITIRFRLRNLPESQKIAIRDIRSRDISKLVTVEGLVRQASDVRPQVTSAKFECPSCGNTISILQLDTRFREPSRCSCGRRGGFRLLGKDLVDAQRLIVEETPESLEGGAQPKRISVFLKEDLVDPKMEHRTTPGSKLRVTGIVKEVQIVLGAGIKSIRFDLIVEANYVELVEETFEESEISPENEKEIKELAKDPKIYEKLVRSVAPSIYGHDDIKEALILQLMGGVKKEREDGTKTRGDMHILLIGDPGSGKSEILQFISKVAPRSRLVSGKGVTGAGLTATVVRDEFLRGWALEAGALVLSNKGYCIVDELDKINPEDVAAMHQALEQQIITIAKANIQATMKAETTVLAAANPKFGRFDPYRSVAEQIAMPPTLINRFDLIFPIKDLPSKEKDTKIATHMLALQQKPSILKYEVPIDVIKKYISYVKRKVFPKLSDGAIDEIKNFYINLRNTTITGEETTIKPIPISPRQLEALVRLAEGSARVRLSKTVTRKDAKKAINILRKCLMDVGFDYETGQIDIDKISTGIPASQRSRIGIIRDLINDLEKKVGKSIPLEDLIAEASEKGITEDQVEEVVENLKRSGDLFEPRRGFIQRI